VPGSYEVDEALFATSSVSPAFKDDVVRFLQAGEAERVAIKGFAPRVKVARVLKQVLAEAGELEIERVHVTGRSGCSDFTGCVEIETTSGTVVYDFVWCCRWRAEQEGWTDYFGFPDQMRAAREFDWRCFQVWSPRQQ
jgi:hypothetical protein